MKKQVSLQMEKPGYLPGQEPHRLPFLYFLQHFFLPFFSSTIGRGKNDEGITVGKPTLFLTRMAIYLLFI